MAENELSTELLTLFKALADKNRIKIIGLLAQRPHAVEELSQSLNIGASTVSHHLSILGRTGLVAATARGYYSIYALKTGPLEVMAKRLLQREKLQNLAAETGVDEYERKVLSTFITPEGRIKAFPMQEKKLLVLLRHVLKEFQPDVRYTEKKVNEILAKYNKDTALLRRGLVEYKFMAREGGGGKYWRIDQSQ
ncbi:MAG: metalloregulator ArsR/SmtB family transcription factor [Bacteroidota bacterium]